jgi:hypothetical protein
VRTVRIEEKLFPKGRNAPKRYYVLSACRHHVR